MTSNMAIKIDIAIFGDMKLIFATANKGKIREAGEILGQDYEIVTPADMGIFEDVEENGDTLRDNSLLKAEHLFKLSQSDCFADDTGLEVEALGGAPGVRSARYAGEGHDNEANMDKLLGELEKLGPDASRKARFRTVVTLFYKGEQYTFEGSMEGQIAHAKAGLGGFGYDPIFIPDEFPGKTLAEIPEEDKNAISHRGRAIRAMAAFLARCRSCHLDADGLQDRSEDR